MASLNQCNFIGNLGKDPEMRFMTNGKAVTNFSVAVTEKWTSDGEAKERTEWVRCTAYGKLAEICGQYLTKGKPVFITGKMNTREWEDKEGVKRYTTEIIVGNMIMLGGGKQQQESAVRGIDGTPADTPPDAEFDQIPF